MRSQPELAAALRATSPFASPRSDGVPRSPVQPFPNAGAPAASVSQQEARRRVQRLPHGHVQRQAQGAMGQLRLQNIDATDAGWRPPWGWIPDASPNPGDVSRAPFMQAFAARPAPITCRQQGHLRRRRAIRCFLNTAPSAVVYLFGEAHLQQDCAGNGGRVLSVASDARG